MVDALAFLLRCSWLLHCCAQVVEITRKFTVEGDELRYSVDMATQTQELQPHLQAVLKKVPWWHKLGTCSLSRIPMVGVNYDVRKVTGGSALLWRQGGWLGVGRERTLMSSAYGHLFGSLLRVMVSWLLWQCQFGCIIRVLWPSVVVGQVGRFLL